MNVPSRLPLSLRFFVGAASLLSLPAIAAEAQTSPASVSTVATVPGMPPVIDPSNHYSEATDGKLNVTKVRFGKRTGGKAGGGKKKSDATSQPQNQ